MKNVKLLSLFLILMGSFGMTSCSTDVEPIDPAVVLNPTDPTDPTNPTTGTSFFKVDFNNQTYVATVTTAYIAGGTILISGARGVQGENIGMVLNGSAVGTYASDEDLVVYNPSATSEYDYANMANAVTAPENTGSVTITEINQATHMISGTFHFVGHWSDYSDDTPPAPITFTNGSFHIPFTSASTSTDVFKAKIDGTAFNPALISASAITVNGQDWIGVGGASSTTGSGITVGFKEGISAGTYTITGNVATDVVQASLSIGDEPIYRATSGSVTITTITASHVKGTFHFNAVNSAAATHSITEGTFDMDY